MQHRIKEYGSEYDWSANQPFLLATGNDPLMLQQARKFRSGRDALKAVAMAAKDRYKSVLLPALCCESMVSPFTMHGVKPVFYRLKQDYTADVDDVTEKMSENAILLYGTYFGIEPFSVETLEQIRKTWPNALLLEDRTQDLLCSRQASFEPDVTIASARKWFAIGDGGLLCLFQLTNSIACLFKCRKGFF